MQSEPHHLRQLGHRDLHRLHSPAPVLVDSGAQMLAPRLSPSSLVAQQPQPQHQGIFTHPSPPPAVNLAPPFLMPTPPHHHSTPSPGRDHLGSPTEAQQQAVSPNSAISSSFVITAPPPPRQPSPLQPQPLAQLAPFPLTSLPRPILIPMAGVLPIPVAQPLNFLQPQLSQQQQQQLAQAQLQRALPVFPAGQFVPPQGPTQLHFPQHHGPNSFWPPMTSATAASGVGGVDGKSVAMGYPLRAMPKNPGLVHVFGQDNLQSPFSSHSRSHQTFVDETQKRFLHHIFYLDIEDQKFVMTLKAQILRLGGQVDSFFSKKITHLISTRAERAPEISVTVSPPSHKGGLPAPTISASTEIAPTQPQAEKDQLSHFLDQQQKPGQKKFSLPRGKQVKPPATASLIPSNENDVLVQAQRFGMKIWSVESGWPFPPFLLLCSFL